MTRLPHTSQGNVKGGLWFVFPLGERTIHAWGGATGLECVYLDGHVVSEHRNVGRLSTHTFSVDGQVHAVAFRTLSYLKAHVECTLLRNKEVIKIISVRYVRQTPAAKHLLLTVAAGAAIGVGAGFMKWPLWPIFILLGGLLLVQARTRPKAESAFVFEERSVQPGAHGDGPRPPGPPGA